jgi:hypothetical protein
MEYPKINTLFKRDADNIIIPSQFTQPEFEYLKDNKFECTEKIDGTNIRIEIKGKEITFKGRTERAIIPTHLLNYLKSTFTPEVVFKALGVDPCIGCVSTVISTPSSPENVALIILSSILIPGPAAYCIAPSLPSSPLKAAILFHSPLSLNFNIAITVSPNLYLLFSVSLLQLTNPYYIVITL